MMVIARMFACVGSVPRSGGNRLKIRLYRALLLQPLLHHPGAPDNKSTVSSKTVGPTRCVYLLLGSSLPCAHQNAVFSGVKPA
eukprot:jgi/Chrzof1/3482/Cz12g27030.t1